jgi:2-polyprenyl-6-methoxyphenol hydroxylase-like FAD-dependent oxidoreductase
MVSCPAVAIVGGGPVGMCAALLLSRFKVPTILLERRSDVSVHPKSRAINVRTMEIFRFLGLDGLVRSAGMSGGSVRFVGKDAVSPWAEVVFSENVFSPLNDLDLSPLDINVTLCSQDALEPILRDAILAEPLIDVRFGHTVRSVSQDDEGVELSVSDHASTYELCTPYLIAADGAGSGVRKALGIGLSGADSLQEAVSVLFRSDFLERRTGTKTGFIYLDNPDTVGAAIIAPVDETGRAALLGRPKVMDRQPFDQIDWDEQLRAAVGDPDQDFEIIDASTWNVAARVADSYQEGRIFLAGDAAHVMPPFGGFNMNTGIQDVHNLAWKLSAVITGWATKSLLASYTTERRPVAVFNANEALLNFRSHIGRESDEASSFRGTNFVHPGLDLGFRYYDGAIWPRPAREREAAWPVETYAPSAQPGERAPHVWLRDGNGHHLSTLDLFGCEVVMFSAPHSSGSSVVSAAAAQANVPIRHAVIGEGSQFSDEGGLWASRYEATGDTIVLVRPDGHILARLEEPTFSAAYSAFAAIGANVDGGAS